jgi:hypothetical protein
LFVDLAWRCVWVIKHGGRSILKRNHTKVPLWYMFTTLNVNTEYIWYHNGTLVWFLFKIDLPPCLITQTHLHARSTNNHVIMKITVKKMFKPILWCDYWCVTNV